MSCFIIDISCAVAALEIAESFESSNSELHEKLDDLRVCVGNTFNTNFTKGSFDDIRKKMATVLAIVNVSSYNECYPDQPAENYEAYIPESFRVQLYLDFVNSKKYIGEEYRFTFDEKIYLQALKWLECYWYNSLESSLYSDFLKIINDIINCMKDIYIYNSKNYAAAKWGR